jgi:acetyl-CoA carboxylase biotin carboxyl carrier protein
MTIEREDIKDIVNAVAVAGIEEFSLEIGDLKVRLRRHAAPGSVPAAGAPAPPTAAPRPPAPARAQRETAPASVPASPRPDAGALVAVTAPLIGTFYRTPSPGAPPFVEVGSRVEPDDTVCIVEVMKLMNAVRAGCRGRVVEICAENGALVEYGQTLMLIDPVS